MNFLIFRHNGRSQNAGNGMGRWIILVCALVLMASIDVSAQKAPHIDDGAYFSLYKTAGRSWSWKRTPKAGQEGGDMDIYIAHTEVKNVYGDYAELETRNLDKNGRPMKNSPPQTVKIKFDRDSAVFKTIGFNKVKDEWVKVKAGKFFCRKLVDGDGGAFVWRSLKYHGLMVKSDDRFGSRELITFEEFDDDPEYVPPGKKPNAKDNKKPEVHNLFDDKIEWTVRVTNTPTKGAATIHHLHYEFASLDDEKAVIEVSKLTQHRKKIRGEEPTKIEILMSEIEDWYEPRARAVEDRVERRQVEGGVFNCKVWHYTDDQGNKVQSWFSQEWRGLEIRRVVTKENSIVEYELVELED